MNFRFKNLMMVVIMTGLFNLNRVGYVINNAGKF